MEHVISDSQVDAASFVGINHSKTEGGGENIYIQRAVQLMSPC